MDIDKISTFLKAKKPLDILNSISQANTGDFDVKLVIRLVSNSGYVTEGIPLHIADGFSVIYNVQYNNVSYVDVSSIASIEVPLKQNVAEILTDGAYFEISDSETPSRLELKRKIQDASDNYVQQYGVSLSTQLFDDKELGNVERYQFKKVMLLLTNAIDKIATDDFGKASLEGMSSINIGSTENELEVEKNEDRLSVKFNLKRKIGIDVENKLIEKIESKL